jgi:OmpA-OmpF porin, OOP family
MKKTIFFLLSLTIFVASAGAQNVDTLIYAEGKILNAATKELVVSKITYQSLPYGSKIGFLIGSSYSFPLFDNEKYSITVEAPGFAPSKYMIDPAATNSERKVIKDIELGLPGTAATEAEITHQPGKVMRLDNLIFKVSTATISEQSYPELTQVAQMLKDNPKMIIQLEGHTDSKGDPKQNMKLSQKRVVAVKDFLVSKGASKSKIKTKAFGGTQPISSEQSEAGHNMNRRVELRVLKN